MTSQALASFLLFLVIAGTSASPLRTHYGNFRQLESAQEVISNGVRNNLIHSLNKLGSATEVTGTNVARASALLIRSLVSETFNLGSVLAYVPRLLFLDGPNQFIETLRLIRSNRLQAFPNDVNGAIDNLITFTGSVRDSGITGKLAPVVEFFPNVFTGVETWVRDVTYNVFAFVGPLPSAGNLDKDIASQALRIVSTTESEITNPPARA